MIVCVIPAKKDSKRLDDKNMQFVGGRNLIDYTIAYAKKSKLIDKIFVSTDSDEIASHCTALGVEVIRRDKSLSGEADVLDVYKDALKKINNVDAEYMVCLQADHPDRSLDLDSAIELSKEKIADDLISVNDTYKRNGSVRIIKASSLKASNISRTLLTVHDSATNIHTKENLLFAAFKLRKRKDIHVDGKIIGKNAPVFVIAEAANNHMCNLDNAKLMIDKAKEAGADAIKFQTYKAERLVVRSAKSYWSYGGTSKSQFEYYKNLDKFKEKEYRELFAYAEAKGIIWLSTPFDVESAVLLNEVGVKIFKVASVSIPDIRLLRKIASFMKPVILSTGGATVAEIKRALCVFFEEGNFDIALLACTLSYPTSNEHANILKVKALMKEFPDFIIGLSDHTEPDAHMIIPSLAIPLGAKIIEKHYTLNRTWKNSGHSFSVEPEDLKKMIQNIRLAELVMGKETVDYTPEEDSTRQGGRGSIVANKDIKKGELITDSMIAIKRPGTGVCPSKIYDIIGKKARTDIKEEEQISMKDIS